MPIILTEAAKAHILKTNETIIKIAAVVAAVTAIAGGYTWYINNIWKPNVTVLMVDFTQGVAQVQVGKKAPIDIYGDASFSIGGNWAVRLGSTGNTYDSLELTKSGLVVEYLKR